MPSTLLVISLILFTIGCFLLIYGIRTVLVTLREKGLPQGIDSPEIVWMKGLKRLGFVAWSGFALMLIGIMGGIVAANQEPSPPATSGTITVGSQVDLVQKSIAPAGGNITVDKPGDPLNGLLIEIPADSYRDTRAYHLSYAPVKKHTFGKSFNPISPLVSIENGGGYSNEIIQVKIPVKVPDGHFAMAFFYDEKNGTLEGMPLVSADKDSVTVATRHFSSFVVSSIQRKSLYQQTGEVESSFKPGVDDWQFTNWGTYIAPGGQCAGQSITAMWYHITQKLNGKQKLFGLLDNNFDQSKTPGIWQDDSLGYRFASTIQEDINWEKGYAAELNAVWHITDDELIYNAFAYAIVRTGQPQFVVIGDTKNNAWHAMIVYKVKDNKLYVADPNFPGRADRTIEFKNGKFIPYDSADNYIDILLNRGRKFDRIIYISTTGLIDWGQIASRWSELQKGAVGNDRFPAYKIEATEDKGPTYDLKSGLTVRKKTIFVSSTGSQTTLGTNVYQSNRWLYGEQTIASKTRVELEPGNNHLGIAIWGLMQGTKPEWKVVDFKWVEVVYNPPASVELEPPQAAIRQGSRQQFRATAKDSNGKMMENLPASAFTWSSANSQIAAVNQDGSVIGLSLGSAVISAALGDTSGSASLTVLPPDVDSIQLDPPSATIMLGKTQLFRAMARDDKGTLLELPASSFSWASANTAVATVDRNGLVTGQAVGTTAVAAASGKAAGSAIVRVISEQTPSPAPLAGKPDLTVTSVGFSPSSGRAGQTFAVSFTVKNQGGAASGPFSNRISLATTRYGTNYSLGNFSMEPLAAGASRTSTVTTGAIPSSVPPGSYWVTVFTDGFQQVAESEENNNIGSSDTARFTVTAATPPPTSGSSSISGIWKGQAVLETTITGGSCRYGGNITLSLTQTGTSIRGTINYDLGGDPANSRVRCPATRVYGSAQLAGEARGGGGGSSVRFSFTTSPPFAGFTINASGLQFYSIFEGDFTGDARGEFHVEKQ